MNLFRSVRTSEEKEPFEAEIVDGDDDSCYAFSDGSYDSENEDPFKKAVELENILGNALAMAERSNGSIHSLSRNGTNSAIEVGRRIASKHSLEEIAASNGLQFDNDNNVNDAHSYVSRTSSLGSVASLPTFVRVNDEEPIIYPKRSWDVPVSEYREDEHSLNTEIESKSPRSVMGGNFSVTPQTLASTPQTISKRSWNKLRREVDEEKWSKKPQDEGIAATRTMSMGRNGFGFRKKGLQDSSKKSAKKISNDTNGINRTSSDIESYAKDYDVEVSLQHNNSKQGFWGKNSSKIRGGKGEKAALASTPKGKSLFGNREKKRGRRKKRTNNINDDRSEIDRTDIPSNVSFETPRTLAVEDSSAAPAEGIVVDRNSDVVVKMHEMHKGDVLFQALEVACCHCIDNGKTLDVVTEMLPPYI
mmetsp:Transcript_6623/g.14344  ORF Transcript_6623/g.14344 Transcript_6623/m.14344 type:complete len:418 (+) Transcript_6623:130-1383(+)